MPPPAGFRIEISKLETRFNFLIEKFPGEEKDIVLTGESFKDFSDAAYKFVYGPVTYDPEEGEVCHEPIVDESTKDVVANDGLSGIWLTDTGELKFEGIPDKALNVLDEVLRAYEGRTLDFEARNEMAWRIAGGFKLLRKGIRLKRSFGPGETDWTLLRIEDVLHGKVFNGQRGPVQTLELWFRVVSGPYSGLRFKQYIPYKFMMYKLAREIGFPAFTKIDKNELVLAYFVGNLNPDGKFGPEVLEFFASQSLKTRNRRLFKNRHEPCVKKEKYQWSCFKCTLGHKFGRSFDTESESVIDGRCFRATHSNTYVKRLCSRCKEDGYFEPADKDSSVCIKCKNNEAYSRLKIMSK